jgi:hypothetical protein
MRAGKPIIMKPQIDKTKFDSIAIEGEKQENGVLILLNRKVK